MKQKTNTGYVGTVRMRVTAIVLGLFFGAALPLMGLSGSAFMLTVYWTIVLVMLAAYICHEFREALEKTKH